MGLLGSLDLRPTVQPFKALVARGVGSPNRGSVVCCVGQILQSDIEEAGLSDINDLQIPGVPEGLMLAVYEGNDHWHDGSYEHPDDGEWSRKGAYRPLTVEEWSAVMAGRNPWLKPERDLWPSALTILTERKGCHCELHRAEGKVLVTFVETRAGRWEAVGAGDTMVAALIDLGVGLETRRRPEGLALKRLIDETDFGPGAQEATAP